MHHDHATPDPESVGSNPSANDYFGDVVASRFSRRSLLGGGLGAAAVVTIGSGVGGTVLSGCAPDPGAVPLLGFESVPASSADKVTVADGYVAEVLIPWGTPLLASGPAWKKDGSNTAEEQAQQVGFNHDGMHFFPDPSNPDRAGVLVVNHEYTDASQIYPDGGPLTQERVDKALAGHGVSVVRVELRNGRWRRVDSPVNRRITGLTPVAFSGPVGLGHPLLQSANAAMGTLNNCANGHTPWGTYLTCEENFNGYFGTGAGGWTPSALEARYGLSAAGFGYNWHTVDPRFDIAVNPGEANRFGWVVEIDPVDPSSTPVKRTALGRYKHEGATVTEAGGHVVVYSGDDENKDYVYKFVGNAPWRDVLDAGLSPLDEGALHVAKFNSDGSGEWLPLVHGVGPLTVANGWVDQADVLIRTRAAADAVGATKLDRPEWVAVNPASKDVYVTLTNGSSGPSAVNPRNPNPYGSIVRWTEAGDDNRALTFAWDIFVLCGDPAYPGISTPVDINGDIYGSPDGLAFDNGGRLWIQTDISNSSQLRADRGYDNIGNNQMLAADPLTGETRRFLVGPRGCEITGVSFTPDHQTMFINVQHPGEATTAIGAPTAADPRVVSNWPDHDPAGRPRPATLVIRKIGGGVIGA